MKRVLALIAFTSMSLYSNENWIKIEPIDKTPTPKPVTTQDVNLSKIEPINKMMKNATVVKQLIDVTSKKEKKTTNDKNWFVIRSSTAI